MDVRVRPLASHRVGSPKHWGWTGPQALRWRKGTERCGRAVRSPFLPAGGALRSLPRPEPGSSQVEGVPMSSAEGLARCQDSARTTGRGSTSTPTTSRSGWCGSSMRPVCRGRRSHTVSASRSPHHKALEVQGSTAQLLASDGAARPGGRSGPRLPVHRLNAARPQGLWTQKSHIHGRAGGGG